MASTLSPHAVECSVTAIDWLAAAIETALVNTNDHLVR